jgi:hypothetical protein
MRALKIAGCLVSATALLGCVPSTLAYRQGLWSSVRQTVGKVFTGEPDDARMRVQNRAPGAEDSAPPYGYQPPPLTDTSSESAPSTSIGERYSWVLSAESY